MADEDGTSPIRLGGELARRHFAAALWRDRASVGMYCAILISWVGLFVGAWWASAAVGLGSQWSAARLAISCAGAASEVFVALLLPVIGLIGGDDDYPGPGGAAGYAGHGGCGGRCGPPPRPDSWAIVIACSMCALVIALDLARFAAPSMSWAPHFVQMMFGSLWFFFDAFVAAAAAAVWMFVGYMGLLDIHRSSSAVGAATFSALERESIGRSCKQASSEGTRASRRL